MKVSPLSSADRTGMDATEDTSQLRNPQRQQAFHIGNRAGPREPDDSEHTSSSSQSEHYDSSSLPLFRGLPRLTPGTLPNDSPIWKTTLLTTSPRRITWKPIIDAGTPGIPHSPREAHPPSNLQAPFKGLTLNFSHSSICGSANQPRQRQSCF